METVELSEDGSILHIRIPMQLRKRGGKKVIINPDGQVAVPATATMPDDPMVRALVKARKWQTMLESGEVATIKELAKKEGVERSYLARILKLNSLAPQIVDLVLSGNYPDSINLQNFRDGIPLNWDEQMRQFGVV